MSRRLAEARLEGGELGMVSGTEPANAEKAPVNHFAVAFVSGSTRPNRWLHAHYDAQRVPI